MTASDLRLGARWLVARLKLTLRNPRAVVFTIAFPLLLIVLFSGLNGNATVNAMGGAGKIKFAQFYTPSIAIFSLIAACYTSLVLGVATARDQGLFKRVRGTPLPMGIYLGSWIAGAAMVGIAAIVILFAVAVPALDSASWTSKILGFAALILASVNIFGGFLVTARMLAMYKKKERR